jgi:hypothetical protein
MSFDALSPYVSPLCVCIVAAIVAAFYAATPIDTGFLRSLLSSIQPIVMIGALRHVYARLIYGVRMVRHSNQHVISVGCVVSNTAAFETAMI